MADLTGSPHIPITRIIWFMPIVILFMWNVHLLWSGDVELSDSNLSVSMCTINLEILAGFYFLETLHVRSFVKIKPLWNGEITLLLTDIGNSCLCRKFLKWQIRLFTPFTKIKFSRKFQNLQYLMSWTWISYVLQLCPYIGIYVRMYVYNDLEKLHCQILVCQSWSFSLQWVQWQK